MAAGGVGPCCITGAIRKGSPTGNVAKVAGLDAYIAEPSGSPTDIKPGVIVMITDIFGWTVPNARLLADDWADKSKRTVYVPDFMFGDIPEASIMEALHPIDGTRPSMMSKVFTLAKSFTRLGPWFYYHRQSVTIPLVKSFFTELRALKPDTKIGVAGFCWGGRYAILLTQDTFSETKLVDAAFAGHPSLVGIPKDVQCPSVPLSVAVASTDRVYSPSMGEETEKFWEKRDVDFEIVVYEGAKHGFCVRGNMNNEKEKEDMLKSSEQAVKWFDKYLK